MKTRIINKFDLIQDQSRLFLNYALIIYAFIFPIDANISKSFIGFVVIPLFILSLNFKEVLNLFMCNRILQIVSLLISLILISYLWSEQTIGYYGDFSDYNKILRYYFIFPFLAFILSFDKKYTSFAITSFLLGMFISIMISYGIYFDFFTISHTRQFNLAPFYSSHISYSTFLGFTIILTAYRLVTSKNNWLKVLYSLFFLTIIGNLFLSAGRTGQMALLLTFMVLILIYFRHELKKLLVSILVLISVFIFSYINFDTFNYRVNVMYNDTVNVFYGKNYGSSFGTRIMAFITIPYLVNSDNILFGVGMGDKPTYVKEILVKDFPYEVHNFTDHGYLHNSHIEFLVSNGIVGLFIYLSLFYYLITTKFKDRFIEYMSKALGIYFICYGLSADIFFFYEPMMLLAFFLALIAIQDKEIRNKT